MNELDKISNRYLSKDGNAITFSDFEQGEVTKLFQNMRAYERPDILSVYDNKIVAIEHFEFDSYKKTRKGSNFRIQDNVINQKMKRKMMSELADKKDIWLHDEIKNTGSLQQYYNNFKTVLLAHIDNIPEYRNHITSDFENEKDIEFWFFVEDVTPLGNYACGSGETKPRLLLPFSKENLDILRKHNEIKGIIFGIYAMHEYKLVLMYNDDETLDELESDEYHKVTENEFMNFNPQTTRFAASISEEEMKAAKIDR